MSEMERRIELAKSWGWHCDEVPLGQTGFQVFDETGEAVSNVEEYPGWGEPKSGYIKMAWLDAVLNDEQWSAMEARYGSKTVK
jgi:hypothetical protein